MAGNSNSGRKKTPRGKLKLYGGKPAPAVEIVAPGQPVEPDGLQPEAQQLWDTLVPELMAMGIVSRIDSTELRSMCELWGLYRAAVDVAKSDPLNKDARISVTSYRAAFQSLAIKFGLNPVDRMRLEKAPEDKSDFDSFMEQHA